MGSISLAIPYNAVFSYFWSEAIWDREGLGREIYKFMIGCEQMWDFWTKNEPMESNTAPTYEFIALILPTLITFHLLLLTRNHAWSQGPERSSSILCLLSQQSRDKTQNHLLLVPFDEHKPFSDPRWFGIRSGNLNWPVWWLARQTFSRWHICKRSTIVIEISRALASTPKHILWWRAEQGDNLFLDESDEDIE